MTWNLADAKNRLSEVVNLALSESPQTITRRNDTVVVISSAKYEELTGKTLDFKEYLLQGGGLDELDLTRDQGPGRDVDLRGRCSTPTSSPSWCSATGTRR
ncbi:type II toxin-antitoxin system prevent-host-death family antitoxin [Planctomyces sp. SH-PL62]|uniref:type II toxin-antitoxin system prevent-host-death family antitoxin n=1 Tax=Planctomyces sp. SH-PL62 TaxID=1636152 RepID=UPI00078E1B7B|nr:type II toxin-antitoxin system prevent-host-death family antitoxin [Planctomyces sp. SH-PL62]AMV37401.1 Phd_YefM [Planctomyces sp. SH-PL62]